MGVWSSRGSNIDVATWRHENRELRQVRCRCGDVERGMEFWSSVGGLQACRHGGVEVGSARDGLRTYGHRSMEV